MLTTHHTKNDNLYYYKCKTNYKFYNVALRVSLLFVPLIALNAERLCYTITIVKPSNSQPHFQPDTNVSSTLPLTAPPPVPPVTAQSARQARPAAASGRLAPRRLRSPGDVDTALRSRHPAWIPHLIRGLGSRDAAVQRAARGALPTFGEAGMIALLRAAAHERGIVREAAVSCLGEWGDARALQPLLLALKHDRRDRNFLLVMRFVGAVIGSMAARYPHEADQLWAQVKSETRLRVHACAALGRLGDMRAVVPLVEMARTQDQEVGGAARQALARLLPIVALLPPEQARLLGTEGVPSLLTLLNDLDEPLVRLTLAALRGVGDSRAIPNVSRLAADGSRPYVQYEANLLLQLLHSRAAQEQSRSTLLRGATAPQTRTPDVLLRPATTPTQVHPDELMRGAQSPAPHKPENNV